MHKFKLDHENGPIINDKNSKYNNALNEPFFEEIL